MAEILFVTWDGGGNVPPALGLARALQRRGHRVRFVGHPGQRPALEAAGFEVAPAQDARAFAALDPHTPLDMLRTFADPGLAADMLRAAESADLTIIDCLLFGALRAAHRAGLRFAVLEHFYDRYYRQTFLQGPLSLVLRLRGLHPTAALNAAAVRLVASHPALDPVSGPNLRQIGPIIDLPDHPAAGDPDAVLVSMSTFHFPGMAAALQRLLDAVGQVGARAVVTTGPAIDPATLTAPPKATLHRYRPHADLMPAAALFIGHGGHGSTMQALAHGLPAIAMPMDARSDQPLVGRSLEHAGVGRQVAKGARPDQLAAVIRTLLSDGSHRAAAATLGASLRATRCAEAGADAIEQHLPGPRLETRAHAGA